jgi:DNA-binding winged helix-turn-helix (wHTH) protein
MVSVPDATRQADAGAPRAGPRLLQWPDEHETGAALVARGRPCVWLVPRGAAPPEDWDDIEDWVRVPADPADLMARVAAVAARASVSPVVFHVDGDDLLWCDDRCVALSALEGRLMRALVRSARQVVSYASLVAEGWPGGARDPKTALPAPIKLLRRKIAALDFSIHTVPGRGYLLEPPARGRSVSRNV